MASTAQGKYTIKLEDKTKRAFRAIGRSLKSTTSAVFSMRTGFVAAAGIAGIGYFVKKSLDATDEMAKMSRAIGVSVENLQRLRHAASLGGLESTQLDKAVQKLSVNMADMSKGVGLAKDVFEKYGISVENSDGSLRRVVDVLADVSDVTVGLTNRTEKADLAYKLFGARGGKMINVLEGGSKAMREAMLEADKLGLVMSEDTAKGVEQANDAMTRLSSFMTSSFTQAVAKLAPAIQTITDSIRAWVEMKVTESGGIGAIARDMAEGIIVSAVGILEAFETMGNAVLDFGRKIEQLPGMGSRPIDVIKKDIFDLESQIGMLKSSLKGGTGLLDLLGVGDEHSLGVANEQLVKLYKELSEAGNNFSNIERFDSSQLRKSLMATLPIIQKTTKEFDILKGDNNGSGDKVAKNTAWDKMTEGFNTYKASVGKGTASIASITNKSMKGLEDGIVNMLMGVDTSFKAMTRSIIAGLLRIQVQKAIVGLMPTGGSGILDDISKVLGFANGGRPPMGRVSVVGERGPELFVPDQAGTVVPNHQLGSSGQGVKADITFNIQTNDAQSFQNLLINSRNTIESIVNNSLTGNGSVRQAIRMSV